MRIYTTYSVKIKHYNHILKETVRIYRAATDFLIDVCLREWDGIRAISGSKNRQAYVESLTIATKKHPSPKYPAFARQFYKFPSYLRRSAISEAIGKVSSYQSNRQNWLAAEPESRGAEPGLPRAGYIYPCLYKDNMYEMTGVYTAKIKVFIRNTWDWIAVELRKSDIDYIRRHCADRKQCAPTLQKRGKEWSLDFPFQEERPLHELSVFDQTIVAVDLGINSACACSVMRSDGTIVGRHFLRLPTEYDSLERKIGHIKYAQCHGSRRVPNLWKYADGINDAIAVKTAQFITDVAVLYSADTIVFEHLDLQGRKRGSKKQRLHLWKAARVQAIVTDKAHRLGMRISRICAWGTSRLAYDGSGRVLRGRQSAKTNNNYSLCEFPTGKVYNCDLNASYNIGARYFVRELMKSLPATEGQRIAAKVPGCVKRSTCTLSTLISLDAELRTSERSIGA